MKTTVTSKLVDRMFRAFSDRNRLRILHLLQDGEMCVGDIVNVLQVPQARVSRHLAYLRKAELVQSRTAGLWRFYRLTTARNEFHGNLLNCLASCFRGVPEIKADARRAERIRESGGCCPASAKTKTANRCHDTKNKAGASCCST
jgi:ArsR family transcriptional regulator